MYCLSIELSEDITMTDKRQCCELDDDRDGNCAVHSAPGVFRIAALNVAPTPKPDKPTESREFRDGFLAAVALWEKGFVSSLRERAIRYLIERRPEEPTARIGPFCEKCQQAKLEELRRQGDHGTPCVCPKCGASFLTYQGVFDHIAGHVQQTVEPLMCKHDDGACHKDDPCEYCPIYRKKIT